MNWQDLTKELFSKLEAWLTALFATLPNLTVALLILVLGWYVARTLSRVVLGAITRVSHNAQVNALAARTVHIGAFLTAVFFALGVLNLDKTVTSLLAGLGVVGVALGFAFQDIAANFMAGIMMAFRQPIQLGDLIETNGHQGQVIDIDLRATTLHTVTGEHVLIPNKDVFGAAIVNYTRSPRRRLDLSCGVAYGTDLRKVQAVAKLALEPITNRDPEREVNILFTGFGGSSVDFVAQVWLSSAAQPDYNRARSESVIALHESFEKAGIEIPFPIRTLKFGGQTLRIEGRTADSAPSTD